MLTAHQPCYLPWAGFFDKLRQADTFILLNELQYATGSDNFVNRNRIKGPGGAEWLTIPVRMGGHLGRSIKDMEVAFSWRDKHLAKLKQCYSQSPYLDFAFTLLPYENHFLGVVCIMSVYELVELIMPEHLHKLKVQSNLGLPPSHKTQLIIDLCKAMGERTFLFGGRGRDYADLDLLRDNGIEAVFQEYQTPQYPQQWDGWLSNLSIIDMLLNVGTEETRRLLRL